MINWIRNLFRKRYINLGRIAYLENKGVTPLFSLFVLQNALKRELGGILK